MKTLYFSLVLTLISGLALAQCAQPGGPEDGRWEYDDGVIWSCGQFDVGLGGIDSPSERLHINGAVRSTRLRVNNSTASTTGSVALLKGTSNPSIPKVLDIENSSGNSIFYVKNNEEIVAGRLSGSGSEAVLSLGDGNHYIKSMWGKGVSIGTYSADDVIFIKESSGKVGIGVGTNHTFGEGLLEVEGTIRAQKVVVETSGWGDYVFDKEYDLMELAAIEDYINKHHHLPGIPSAKDLETKGLDLGELVRLQMVKIEELTLYVLELENRLSELEGN